MAPFRRPKCKFCGQSEKIRWDGFCDDRCEINNILNATKIDVVDERCFSFARGKPAKGAPFAKKGRVGGTAPEGRVGGTAPEGRVGGTVKSRTLFFLGEPVKKGATDMVFVGEKTAGENSRKK